MSFVFSAAAAECDVAILGAGIAGLVAAGELVRAGRRVVVLEKSRGIGGRMATRRIGAAVFDHGAQFFTVRGRAFDMLVGSAASAGVVRTWCNGFSRAASHTQKVVPADDGHARWRGMRGMTDLPKHLAGALAVAGENSAGSCTSCCGEKVSAVGIAGGRVLITHHTQAAGMASGAGGLPLTTLSAAAVILTAPVPQSLDLLAAGGLLVADNAPGGVPGPILEQDSLRVLRGIDYDPCFTLMLALKQPSLVPPPGAIQFQSGIIAWIGDNQQKGISPVPALCVHASPALSREHFDAPPAEVTATMLEAVRPWIDGDLESAVIETSLHRWKYAQPTIIVSSPLVVLSDNPPILFAGDAFAGPRVEGAANSGLASGRRAAGMLS